MLTVDKIKYQQICIFEINVTTRCHSKLYLEKGLDYFNFKEIKVSFFQLFLVSSKLYL